MAKKTDISTVGGRIAHARKSKIPRMSQQDLADLCEWEHQSRVSAYELGNREPSLEDIALLANVLAISRAWLATGEGEMAHQPTSQPTLAAIAQAEPEEEVLIRLFKSLEPDRGRRYEVLGFLQRKLKEERAEIAAEGGYRVANRQKGPSGSDEVDVVGAARMSPLDTDASTTQNDDDSKKPSARPPEKSAPPEPEKTP